MSLNWIRQLNQAGSRDIVNSYYCNSDFRMGWGIYCAQVVRIGFYLVHICSTNPLFMAALFVWCGFFGARLRDGLCKLPGGRWDRGPTAEIDPWSRRTWKIPSETGTVRQSLRFLVIRNRSASWPSTSEGQELRNLPAWNFWNHGYMYPR